MVLVTTIRHFVLLAHPNLAIKSTKFHQAQTKKPRAICTRLFEDDVERLFSRRP